MTLENDKVQDEKFLKQVFHVFIIKILRKRRRRNFP